jgi:hypothetical protein
LDADAGDACLIDLLYRCSDHGHADRVEQQTNLRILP